MTKLEKAMLILEENKKNLGINEIDNVSLQDEINQRIEKLKKYSKHNNLEETPHMEITKVICHNSIFHDEEKEDIEDEKDDEDKYLRDKQEKDAKEQKEYVEKEIKEIKGKEFNSQKINIILENLIGQLESDYYKLIDSVCLFIEKIRKLFNPFINFKLIVNKIDNLIYRISTDPVRVLLN